MMAERDFTLLNTKLFNCDDDIHYLNFLKIHLSAFGSKKKKCKFSSVCKQSIVTFMRLLFLKYLLIKIENYYKINYLKVET